MTVSRDAAVAAANRGATYGWARLSHEAQVCESAIKLGGVLLSPAAHQDRLDEIATTASPFGPPGFFAAEMRRRQTP